jgi:hypothetical protein
MDQFHHPTFSFSAPQNAQFQTQQQQQQPFPAAPAQALYPNSQQPLPFQPSHAGNEYIVAPQGYQMQPQVMQQQRLPGKWMTLSLCPGGSFADFIRRSTSTFQLRTYLYSYTCICRRCINLTQGRSSER